MTLTRELIAVTWRLPDCALTDVVPKKNQFFQFAKNIIMIVIFCHFTAYKKSKANAEWSVIQMASDEQTKFLFEW